MRTRRVPLSLALALVLALAAALRAPGGDTLRITAVDSIGMTVEHVDRAVDFYTRVLTFEKVSDTEVSGREYELLQLASR